MRLPSLFRGSDFINFNSDWNDLFTPIGHSNFSQWREEEGKMSIEFDLPGLNKTDIKITCDQGYLQVTAQREIKTAYGQSKKQYHYSAYLPDNVNEDKIEAEYQNGVLKVSVPKGESKPSKQINIK